MKTLAQRGLVKAALVLAVLLTVTGLPRSSLADLSSNATVFASGFSNPRGLKFGPNSDLYVVEAGIGGSNPSACDQEGSIFDPYFSGYTGQISKVNLANQQKSIVASGLPSTVDNTNTVLGAVDLAFIGNTLYTVVFAGCERFFQNVPTSVVRVNADTTWNVVADLSHFLNNNPVAEPPPGAPAGDFESDGSPYGMIAVRGSLYVVEANSGQLLKVSADGWVERVVDLSVNHPVPSSITYHGDFYIGTFGSADTNFLAEVYKVTPSGQVRVVVSGLNPVLGLAVVRGQLYILETYSGDPVSTDTGRILRVSLSRAPASPEVIASGLTFATAMVAGPDGRLYVSNKGFGFGAGEGEIVAVEVE